MEHVGHEFFYINNGDSPGLGNNKDQSNQGPCDYDRAANLRPGNIHQHVAPRALHADRIDIYDGYPLQDPGNLGCVNACILQHPASDTIPDQDVEYYLDLLKELDPGTHDSAYYTLTQLVDSHIATAPTDLTPVIYPSQPQPAPMQHHQSLLNPSSIPTAGNNNNNNNNSNNNHGLEHLQSESVLLQSRNAHAATPPITGKRSRNLQLSNDYSFNGILPRSAKVAKMDFPIERPRPVHRHSPYVSHAHGSPNSIEVQEIRISNSLGPRQAESYRLNKTQKKFIRRWFDNFAKREPLSFLANEQVNALATLIQAPPQPVIEYIHRKFIPNPTTQSTNRFQAAVFQTPSKPDSSSASEYSFAKANEHLPTETLESVRKYVLACYRRRPQNDGRRRVNEGPFRCTYGCGYRTKRPFDWRRHEETHEPQELWLCHLCGQNDIRNPFLVNRKDKFLSHSKSSHKGWDPETVLDMSKLEFHANFNPQCPLCPEISDSWDGRCKHILAHYEDEIDGRSRETSAHPKSLEMTGNTSDEEGSNLDSRSDSTDSSNDDNDQGNSNSGFDKRDPTGGSGGGSGAASGPPTYRGSETGQGSGVTKDNNSIDPYFNRGHDAYSRENNVVPLSDGGQAAMTVGNEVTLLPSCCQQKSAFSETVLQASLESPRYILNSRQLVSKDANFHKLLDHQYFREPLEFLGSGSHGYVDTVRDCMSGKDYARKRSTHKSFSQEIKILKGLTHPHIVEFIAAYSQNSSLNLVMSPIAQLTLRDVLVAPKKPEYDRHRAHTWIGCLSSALSYIHARNIRHADIKPKNILVLNCQVFVTDFGISRPVSESDSTSSSVSPSTPLYAPLEIAERLSHGRKADIFSLGCVVLEILSFVQGKSYKDLYQHLGFAERKKHTSQDPLAYYRAHEKLLSWIALMRREVSSTTHKLWDICECMLQNRADLRPSAALLLEKVRQAFQEGNNTTCQICTFGPPRVKELEQRDLGQNVISQSLALARIHGPFQETTPPKAPIRGISALSELVPVNMKSGDEAEMEKKELVAVSSKSCLISEPPPLVVEMPHLVTDPSASPPSPAYDSSMYPVSITVSKASSSSQPRTLVHVAEAMDLFGKVGIEIGHGSRLAVPPNTLARRLCHRCGTGFVAPRLDQCRSCLHTRCLKCTDVQSIPNSRADSDLAGIGSHLPSHLLPPAYSFTAGGPLTGKHTEITVLNLVVAQNASLGNSVEERFIEERPSTFDRIHLRALDPNSSLLSQISSSSVVDSQFHHQSSDSGVSISTSTSSTSLSLLDPQSKWAKLNNYQSIRLRYRKNPQFISGRSKQSIPIKQQQAMNDYTTNNKLGSQDLNSQLEYIQRSNSVSNDGNCISRITRTGTGGISSFDDSASMVFSRLPVFCKSKTTSTTGSTEVSRLQVLRTIPTSSTNRESVEIEQGEFSKPSFRRRRGTNESSKSHKEFKYYGRHANSWLFNDFSISDQVRKGWGKVFPGTPKSEGEE